MLNKEAKLGDVVIHKYGQHMCIEKRTGPNAQFVYTVWFDPSEKLQRGIFHSSEFSNKVCVDFRYQHDNWTRPLSI